MNTEFNSLEDSLKDGDSINKLIGNKIETYRKTFVKQRLELKDEYENEREKIKRKEIYKLSRLENLRKNYDLLWRRSDDEILRSWTNLDLNCKKSYYTRIDNLAVNEAYKLHFNDPVMIKLFEYNSKYLKSKNPLVSRKFKKFNRFCKLVHENIQLRKLDEETYKYFFNSSEKELWKFISANYNKTDKWMWAR